MRHSRSGSGVTYSLTILAAFVTIAFGVWQAAANARRPVERGAVEIDGALRAYRNIRLDIPERVRVGFLAVSDNATLNSANHFIAQYALAPRIVVAPFDDQVPFVVSGINAGEAADADPRLTGYELAGVREMGVRIFRKSDRESQLNGSWVPRLTVVAGRHSVFLPHVERRTLKAERNHLATASNFGIRTP